MNSQVNTQWPQNMNVPQQMVPGMDVNMVGQVPGGLGADDMGLAATPLSYNQKTSERMRLDEGLSFFILLFRDIFLLILYLN